MGILKDLQTEYENIQDGDLLIVKLGKPPSKQLMDTFEHLTRAWRHQNKEVAVLFFDKDMTLDRIPKEALEAVGYHQVDDEEE